MVVNAFLQVVGRHGCAADMEHLSHYSATCKYKICLSLIAFVIDKNFHKRLIKIFVRENGESCWQVDDASLDHNHGQGNATIFQVRRIVRSTFQVQQICWIHLSSATSHRDICMSEDPHIITIDHT